MWLYTVNSHIALNLVQVTRLFVEDTGTGAALKADIGGKTILVNYYGSKPEAYAAMDAILEKQEAGVSVVRL